MSSDHKQTTKKNGNSNAKEDAHQKNSGIELFIVKAWQEQAWWLWLLLPLSWLYHLIISIKKYAYKLGVFSSYRSPVPVMIVGNITVGGSGKTPLIIELVKFLQHKEMKVGVISRGYGGNESIMPSLVTSVSQPADVGDEPCLIVRETAVNMAVSPNRQEAIELLLQTEPDIQLIIADDGLQHYKLKRDIEWIVVDSDRGFGNKQLLPVGFLREPLSRLKDATVIYHQPPINSDIAKTPVPHKLDNKCNKKRSPKELSIEPSTDSLMMTLEPAKPILLNPQTAICSVLNPKHSPIVYGVSGIGYPRRFFNTLTILGYQVIEVPKPDHHQFDTQDLLDLTQYPIVITSKDAVKIAPLVEQHEGLKDLSIWVLPVQAVLNEACYETLLNQLKPGSIS